MEGLNFKGSCLVLTRDVKTNQLISVVRHDNTLFSGWKQSIAADLVNATTLSRPMVMAFSKDVVPSSPTPTAFTNEFRAAASVYRTGATIQIISVLSATEGNTPSGNIKTIGFYYGSDATTTLLTGTLASIINTLNVAKDSTKEVTFQYDVTIS